MNELLTRSISEIIDRKHLEDNLNSGQKLRVKLGIDPTAAKLHLGHAVVLRILRRFQDEGHTAVLIIGDTTASIGDPSGKNETRPALTAEQIAKNFATYEKQALRILDKSRLEVRWQSEWFKNFNLSDVIREAAQLSAGWILSHETFRNRLQHGQPLAFHELLYPLVQAYDSVAVQANVELGGPDQKFNLLTGRELMRSHKMEPQDIVLGKYLIGTDGQKMGKTTGNFIALEEEPFEMFGKVMALVDEVVIDYFENATTVPVDEIKTIEKELKKGTNPRDIKKRLAAEIVTLYHGEQAASVASDEWQKVFSNKEKPTEIEEVKVKSENIVDVLVETKLASSKSEAKRLIEQDGVRIDDQIASEESDTSSGNLIQVGKRRFIKIK
ncbi:MAG: tyrosine--tRNA ligase [Candidatus Doudnabacteria bacterium RIFCSPLOWO2_02_FULL_49_13]|uniref:Tyrosine--tRNA ligase n=1 Tax=Candidatus Doudnabacteria bacterium RIFCSPHIGHO2_12_FULL_48_16 TaxID=1817838 RepID=A0A1F5PKE5_9BACT|nr:MAG: tyrosine--tRNA ligase [Candidatus Doudnabacteria bacterium RIFCSPHIGHO2_01_FULL_50_67]OGE88894.1 MAG: tyrosine--tRNA ligase [Candidatus Doudnabacteria bacterium RIFCSPHIGHO2_02_FULL_49_24]OGE90418.1 MAG: tyrosine--tRNA ligase [Candidatus Doudnabacteria bacterium RIFCSPHIGHO2_12_FULL_48_16]OGE96745.1 MAG: tyrosine--tRNA ligase [Candidatus Doudnabacteria bacterium RIFCSPLOWO2_01_FULL_49_40]OGF02459.1 MAG: tyrosine--tRNA ligase [Candidatus Doudnabacteria bacterium RIFCSPLOWO2_02_FULL_49_13